MAAIRIISDSTVLPTATTTSLDQTTLLHRIIELTPWDLQLLLIDYIQKGILFTKPATAAFLRRHSNHYDPSDAAVDLVEHLKTSFSIALRHFYPLAGRLVSTTHDDGAATFSLKCSAAGAQFIHAAADGITAAEILGSPYTPPTVGSFFPLNGVLNYEGTSKPLLAVQVTVLADGGVFIGCSMNHSVVDGTSFWNFFNAWAEISRTSSHQISKPPVISNRSFMGDYCTSPIPIPNFPKSPIPHFVSSVPLRERVFNFRKEKIEMLKARASAEIRTSSGTQKKISSLQALLAHLWRAVTRNRKLHPDLEVSYGIVIGVRPRLTPPLPEEYLGNMLVVEKAKAKAGDLEKQGLGFAAAILNEMVAAQTEKEMRRFLEGWVSEPKVKELVEFVAGSLQTGSSPRFPVYEADFGWGKPVGVRSGVGNKYDGKVTVFPGAEEGSVDLEACLLPETLEAMCGDAEFMEVVTV